MDGLLQRLKQRKLVQWALAYIAAAFALIQVLDVVAQRFGWPDQLEKVLILAFALGFFVTLVLAWYHGERGAQKVSSTELAILALLLAVGGGLLWRMTPVPQKSPEVGAMKPAVEPTASAPAKSIAVLAFTDLSANHDQDYFSDGMAEEILNALAQVRDLKVAGRTSSFYFKDHPADLSAIGKALGVANVLEGSVRKQGDKVRITAQLIRVADDTHLWSQAYDGDLSDVFALQERIARAITEHLQVVLQGDQRTLLVPIATTSPEAHNLYLQASAIFNRRDGSHFPDAIADLKQAIGLDPKFARAYSRLAALYDVVPQYSKDTDLRTAREATQHYARSAIALDPTLAESYAALGLSYRVEHRYIEEHDAYERALALDPDDVTTNFWYGLTELMDGYTFHGMHLLDRTLSIDPMLPNALRWRAKMELSVGDLDGAQRNAQRARDLGLQVVDMNLAEIAHARGDNVNAIGLWTAGMRGYLQGMPDGSEAIIAEGLYGDDAARKRAIVLVDAYLAQARHQINWVAPYVMVQLGEWAKALAAMQGNTTNNDADFLALLWTSQGQAMRKSPEFGAFTRAVGLKELWDKYGPPDLCKKNATGDYVCE